MNLANCLPRGILSCPTKRISTRRRLELYTGHCDIKSISLYSRALQVIPCIYPRRVCQLANSTNVSDPWTWLVAVNGPQNLQYSGPEIPDSKIFLSGPANIPHALYEVKSAWWEWTPSVCQPFGPLKSYKHMHVWQVLQNPIGRSRHHRILPLRPARLSIKKL